MLFYICSLPNLLLEIDVVQDLVMERYESYTSKAMEYDISTDSDVLGHFIMCLIASKSTLLRDIILRGETQLFINKLTNLSENEIIKELNCAIKFLNCIDEDRGNPSVSSKLQQQKTLVKNILKIVGCKAKHIFNSTHRRTCCKYEILVPFTFPLKLIAKREVDITKGKAKVRCGLWSNLLIESFELFLEFEIEFLKKFNFLQHMIYESEDDRIRNVIEIAIKKMTGMTFVNRTITADEIDEEIKFFPPCISNLHKILRHSHRLSYYSRYQYTLFLKDIGLSAEENVTFWKNEYSKPHNASSCIHSWEEKVSRYEYQILHIYGLIGTTTLKKSHCCEKFIGEMSLKMNGGCPFVHFTKDALIRSFLKDFCAADVEDIINEKQEKRPQRACALYLHNIARNTGKQRITNILSPLNYYNKAKGSALLNTNCKNLNVILPALLENIS